MQERRKGVHRFADRYLRVGPVALVEVDHVQAQTAQALLTLAKDAFARQAARWKLVPGPGKEKPTFGGHEDFVPTLLNGFADDLFAVSKPVDRGRVDEVDPKVDRLMNRSDGFTVVDVPPGLDRSAHGPGAQGNL